MLSCQTPADVAWPLTQQQALWLLLHWLLLHQLPGASTADHSAVVRLLVLVLASLVLLASLFARAGARLQQPLSVAGVWRVCHQLLRLSVAALQIQLSCLQLMPR